MVGYPLDGPLLEVLLPILAKKNFPLAFGRDLTTHFSKKIFHWSLVGILLPILAKKFSTGLW